MNGPVPDDALFEPGRAAVCHGTVMHRRHGGAVPAAGESIVHEFVRPMSMIWIDPDRPHELLDRHRLWSTRRGAPVRFVAADYGDGDGAALGGDLRRLLADHPDVGPVGELRMLTQPRTWGWLFNPITIYLAWPLDRGAHGPVAIVAEVTSTPWKERHRYVAALHDGRASFDKVLHVSPFLGEDLRYDVTVAALEGGRLDIRIDVVDVHDSPVLDTRLVLDRRCVDGSAADRRLLTAYLVRSPLPTHRVSMAIHAHALRLWRKGVPFVPHPSKRRPPAPAGTHDRGVAA